MLIFRYAFEGTLQAVYGFDRESLDCEKDISSPECRHFNPETILSDLDVDKAKFYVDFIVLCVFFVVLRVSCYFVLRWRVKAQRWTGLDGYLQNINLSRLKVIIYNFLFMESSSDGGLRDKCLNGFRGLEDLKNWSGLRYIYNNFFFKCFMFR